MRLMDLACSFAGLGCHVTPTDKDPACAHYHNHDVFKRSMVAKDELDKMENSGAEVCGFTDNSWSEPMKCRKCYFDLSHHLRQSVLGMGTDVDCWDVAVPKFKSKSGMVPCSGSTGVKRDGRHCVSSWGVWETSYKTWDLLSPHQRESAQACDYNRNSWDGPVDCVTCFEDLSLAKRKQLESVGTEHAKCWDNLMAFHGLDCDNLMTDLPKYHHRKAIYARWKKGEDALQRWQTTLSLHHGWISKGMIGTISMFLLALSFAVCAVSQLRRDALCARPIPLPASTNYALVACDDEAADYALE